MSRFNDAVAIVTGGARGQGAAEARLLVDQGARVIIGDVLDDEGNALADELGDRSRYVHLDVSSEQQWADAVAAAEEWGPVRVLVNNAAILMPASIEDTSVEDYRKVIEVNQIGTFMGMKAVFESMKGNGGGSIVNIASTDGIQSKNGLISYSASKFAIRGMTKTAAIEWGRFGIRVNSVHPGGINTPMGNPTGNADDVNPMYQFHAISRIGEPEEVAWCVAFLASDESSYMTGSELVVDGGWIAGLVLPALPGSNFTPDYGA